MLILQPVGTPAAALDHPSNELHPALLESHQVDIQRLDVGVRRKHQGLRHRQRAPAHHPRGRYQFARCTKAVEVSDHAGASRSFTKIARGPDPTREPSAPNGTTLKQIERNDGPARAVIPEKSVRLSFPRNRESNLRIEHVEPPYGFPFSRERQTQAVRLSFPRNRESNLRIEHVEPPYGFPIPD